MHVYGIDSIGGLESCLSCVKLHARIGRIIAGQVTKPDIFIGIVKGVDSEEDNERDPDGK